MSSRVHSVTIGMPVFNDVDFIEASIQSILNQTFKDFVLIISDDGATDGSEKICAKYAELDNRIQYIIQPKNLGISKNMKFLLESSQSEYFMWAGDDDLYAPTFLESCVQLLGQNQDSVVAFTKYNTIDEQGNTLREIKKPSFSNNNPFQRLKALINDPDDGFGYGLCKTKLIREVQFPTWWWPNKKTPYNNIYPTLCFYLAKGNYYESTEESLFFKRVKTEENTNHKLIGQGNAFYETFAYTIRRFNLITFSSREIRHAHSFGLMLRVYPNLYFKWFVLSVWKQFRLAFSSIFKNRFKKRK